MGSTLREEVKQLMASKESRKEEDKDVIQVLNEKIRENSQMKCDNNHLMQSLSEEREAKDNAVRELEESKQTYNTMNAETVKKLSILVRDKDLEIESLAERNKSLLEIIENEKEK